MALRCTIDNECFEMTTSKHSSIYLAHQTLGSKTLRREAGGIADDRSMGWAYIYEGLLGKNEPLYSRVAILMPLVNN